MDLLILIYLCGRTYFLTYNIQMSKAFNITFLQGIDYGAKNIDEQNKFKQIIYNGFCLYSWLIPTYEIRVIDEFIIDQTNKIKMFKKGSSEERYCSLQTRVRAQNLILYSVAYCEQDGLTNISKSFVQKLRQNYGIKVDFLKSNSVNNFTIQINCKETVNFGLSFGQLFLKNAKVSKRYNYFKPPSRKPNKSKSTLFDAEYCFIQPESRRYYDPKGYHLNLAFQGGGAKGVSYVGVKKAIKKMQERIQKESNEKISFPIRSVIGSSAGGILSLAISAQIQDDDLIDLCYMMDTLVQDRLIPNQHQKSSNLSQFSPKHTQNIQQQFFIQQERGIKNLLHNLGLVQDSLSDIIFETLKQPSVQERIIALFQELNPSLTSLLSYQQPYQRANGENIKNCCGGCCCCCYSNCWSCCGCYPCCKALPGSSCFIEESSQYRKVNVYGLLYAALMTGDAVENILAYALSLFLELQAKKKSQTLWKLANNKKWFAFKERQKVFEEIINNSNKLRNSFKSNFDAKTDKLDQSYLNNILITISKTLTLKQYYDLNGVQFTCTSVDLHDKIQRFFNHKTTPDLPVCKAVQMTGSFPVAFLSLKWKKQWGKYYIYYDRTRREIDLTDHQFTDGGLLANFPLKFLDNQKFREKYFSHKNVKDQTFLYGFGLDQVEDFPEQDKSDKIQECVNNLMQQFKFRLIYKFMFYAMSCGSKKTLQIKNIKLFDFIISLLQALRQSDRNLNKQCFKDEIIPTTIKKRTIQNPSQLRNIKKSIVNFLYSLNNKIQQHFAKSKQEILNDQFNAISDRLSKFEKAYSEKGQSIFHHFNYNLGWKKTQEIQRMIQTRLLLYSSATNCTLIYQQKSKELRDKYSQSDVFLTSSTQHHQHQILLLLHQLKKSFMQLTEGQFQEVKREMYKNCNQYRLQMKKLYDLILFTGEGEVDILNLQRYPLIKQNQVMNLLDMKSKLTPYTVNLFNKLYEQPQYANVTPFLNYFIQENIAINKKNIRNLIKGQIEQKLRESTYLNNLSYYQNPIKIHIIFQASSFSQYYFSEYIKLVEQSILNKHFQIDIISCTNYHAFFGVLYVLGYEQTDIKREMYEIRYLFEQNKKIDQIYNSKEWMNTSIEQIRTLLQREWQKSIDPFTQIELNISQNQTQIDNLINQFQVDRQRLNIAFQKIINYLSSSYLQVSKLTSQARKDRFQKLLNIGKYKKINEAKSTVSQHVFNHFLKYTIHLLMNIAEYIFKSHFKLSAFQNWNQQTLFKGMVIHSLISSLKYRFYIFNVLNKAGLDRNITLSNFYQACDKKILLNFNCINTSQQRFSLINKITKPNMPLWAALMACCSMPYLQESLTSYREWQNRQKGERKIDIADKLFKQYEENVTGEMNNFISGNLVSTLPLELMTNQRLINNRLSEHNSPNIVQIAFSFDTQFYDSQKQKKVSSDLQHQQVINQSINELDDSPLHHQGQQIYFFKQIPQRMQGKRRFINCFDTVKYIFQYICFYCCNCSVKQYFKDLLHRLQTFKILNIRINSHDNLILSLYYDTLIKLPLRIGTLDFYKINKQRPDFADTIRQSEKIVEELCNTFQVNPQNKGQIIRKTSSRTTIQVSYHRQNNTLQRQFYRFKFISYTKWRDFNDKYIIQYSMNTNQHNPSKIQWQKIKIDFVDIKKMDLISNQFRLLIRITYFQQGLLSKIYLLSMKSLQKLQQNPARAIFSFNYRQIYYTNQSIQTVNQPPIQQKIEVKSHFLPKQSRYCSNLSCSTQKLDYILHNEQRSMCLSCQKEHNIIGEPLQHEYSQQSLIAMSCPKCKSNYCLKCKINNFITKKIKKQNNVNSYVYYSPMNQESGFDIQEYQQNFSPIIEKFLGQKERMKNKCSFCQQFAYNLYHQKNIISGSKPKKFFCGLTICKPCLYKIG